MSEVTGLHWKQIKKLVEEHGGEYVDKDQAVAFLMSKNALHEVAALDAPQMLDRALPFGTVMGEIEEAPTARYVQNGHYFDGAGKKVG